MNYKTFIFCITISIISRTLSMGEYYDDFPMPDSPLGTVLASESSSDAHAGSHHSDDEDAFAFFSKPQTINPALLQPALLQYVTVIPASPDYPMIEAAAIARAVAPEEEVEVLQENLPETKPSTTRRVKRHKITRWRAKFPCDYEGCTVTLATLDNLKRHQEHFHTRCAPERYECPKPNCNKTFAWDNGLAEHLKFFHAKKRTIICRKCCTQFKRNSELTRHLRIPHTAKFVAAARIRKRTYIPSTVTKQKRSLTTSAALIQKYLAAHPYETRSRSRAIQPPQPQ